MATEQDVYKVFNDIVEDRISFPEGKKLLVSMGETAIKSLIYIFRDQEKSWTVAYHTLPLFGRSVVPLLLPFLIPISNDWSDWNKRCLQFYASLMLSRVKAPFEISELDILVKSLISIMYHDHADIQWDACDGLRELGKVVIPYLLDEIGSPDKDVRYRIAILLADFAEPYTYDALYRLSKDQDEGVREEAERGIKEINKK